MPPPVNAQLRDLTPLPQELIEERARETQRIQKLLERRDQAGFGRVGRPRVSARQMLEALIAGVRDVAALAELARTRMRAKIP